MAEQFIYHMRDLKKVYPGGKEVLKGIHLSFYPGAKIGVIGGNGSGGNLNIYGGGGNGHGSNYSYGNHTAGSSSMGGTQPSSHRQSNYSHRHQSHCAWGAGGNGSMHGNRGARGREGCVVVYEYYS